MINTFSGSEVGNRYSANFDVVHLQQDPLLAVVADGMGDGRGSALAGRTAVDVFVEAVRAADGNAGPDTIRDAIAVAQQRVGEIGRELGRLAGCTLTALIASAGGFWIAQLGDSRAYRLRGGLLELLTVDHTMAWLGAVNGWYPFDSPEAASARYHLTRFVGHSARPEPDVLSVTLLPGDRYLLCSDGVAEQVEFGEIQKTLQRQSDPAAIVGELLAAAEAAGGRDNATAIVVTVD